MVEGGRLDTSLKEHTKDLVTRWLSKSLQKLECESFISCHSNELESFRPDECLDVFRFLVEYCGKTEFSVLLVFTDEPSDDLDFKPFELSEINIKQAPATFYVCNNSLLQGYSGDQEYKTAMNRFDRLEGLQEVCVYFRCYRNVEAVKNGWEFERCIYVEWVNQSHS